MNYCDNFQRRRRLFLKKTAVIWSFMGWIVGLARWIKRGSCSSNQFCSSLMGLLKQLASLISSYFHLHFADNKRSFSIFLAFYRLHIGNAMNWHKLSCDYKKMLPQNKTAPTNGPIEAHSRPRHPHITN